MLLFLSLVTVQAQTSVLPAQLVLINRAELAVQSASEAEAADMAPENFKLATDALSQAQLFLAKRKTKESDRFALKSIRFAELAASEAKYIQLKEMLESKTVENARLRRELLLGPTAEKP